MQGKSCLTVLGSPFVPQMGAGASICSPFGPTIPLPPAVGALESHPSIHSVLHIRSRPPEFSKSKGVPPYFYPADRGHFVYRKTPRRWYLDVFGPGGIIFSPSFGLRLRRTGSGWRSSEVRTVASVSMSLVRIQPHPFSLFTPSALCAYMMVCSLKPDAAPHACIKS